MKEYRVTITTVREQYEYVVMAENKTTAKTEGRGLAGEDGWNGTGFIEVTRLS